jgi:hypothetical protein
MVDRLPPDEQLTSMRTPLLLPVVLLLACAGPITTAPAPLWAAPPSPGRTAFFTAFRSGAYENLPAIITTLTTEHLARDRTSTAVLGFAHAWRLAESSRTGSDPTVIESASVAHRMFQTAHASFPDDPRLLGFQGSMMMAEGSIHDDPELSKNGYFATSTSAAEWPQWGLFTLAYSLTGQAPDSGLGRQALDSLWQNLETCAPGQAIDRTSTELLTFIAAASQSPNPLIARACGDQPVVPFNFEGFFVVLGDLLARKGDVAQARRMYQTALSTDASQAWPYRAAVERRRDQVAQLAARWGTLPARGSGALGIDDVPLFQGPANCTICHQGLP